MQNESLEEIRLRENRKQYNKEYRKHNHEKELERKRIYRENHKEEIAKHSREYRLNNHEKELERCRIYRENNKDKIKEYMQTKHSCVCGGKYDNNHKARHEKTVKHLKYVEKTNKK